MDWIVLAAVVWGTALGLLVAELWARRQDRKERDRRAS